MIYNSKKSGNLILFTLAKDKPAGFTSSETVSALKEYNIKSLYHAKHEQYA